MPPGCPNPDLCPDTATCTMRMYFGVGGDTCLFLKSWSVGNGAQWVGAFFAIMFLAFMRELVGVWRIHRVFMRKQEDSLRRMYLKDPSAAAKLGVLVRGGEGVAMASSGNAKSTQALTRDQIGASDSAYHALGRSPSPVPLSGAQSDVALQVFDTLYYTASLILGYLLMLLIMTYNTWVCLLVVLGCASAHFLCNFIYITSIRRRNATRVRGLVAQFQEQSRIGGGAVQVQAGGVTAALTQPAPPTGGDHCCDDINFDDI
jgi:hypothetical protein